MPIFLERFVLPVLATSVIGVIVLNPFKLDWQLRASLAIGVVAIAYFVGYTVHKKNRTQKTASKIIVEQQSSGANSPNILGDHNKIT